MDSTNISKKEHYYTKRVVFYWLSFIIGYIVPLMYFIITAGVKKQAVRFVLPTLIACVVLIIKMYRDIPKWTQTWKPSIRKGLVLAIPKILLFLTFVSLGFLFKWAVEKHLAQAFKLYFEVVLVFFGSHMVASIFEAVHLKYLQLDLMQKGYVMGVVNK